MSDPLERICEIWLRQADFAKKAKDTHFSEDAKRIWKFYGDRTHKFLYLEKGMDAYQDEDRPHYQATINKTFQFASTFLPFVQHRVPHRLVEPRRPNVPPELYGQLPGGQLPDPRERDGVIADLLEWVLNYTPGEFDLRGNSRDSCLEGLTKGAGVLWTEVVTGPHGALLGSFYDSIDDLYIDPDARRLRDASYIMRWRRRPVWEVAEEKSIPANKLRATGRSHQGQAITDARTDADEIRREQKDKDTIGYWEVYSRCGLGQRFESTGHEDSELAAQLETVGANVFLEIAPGMKYPLNLVQEHIEQVENVTEYVNQQVKWPIPFYYDLVSPWPCSVLGFYSQDKTPWPQSPIKPALPLQAWLDYAYSWLMHRIKWTGRMIPIMSAALQDEFKDTVMSGGDLTPVFAKDVPEGDIRKAIHMLTFPDMNQDLWRTIQGVERVFEDITGLSPLLRGETTHQFRSAAEAEMKQANVSIRPDDMADCVEAWMSDVARKEAGATRMLVGPDTIAKMSGEYAEPQMPNELGMEPEPQPQGPVTAAWQNLVLTPDGWKAFAEFQCMIESGTGRRPNKAKKQAYFRDLAQVVLEPSLKVYYEQGDPTAYNAFMRLLIEAHDEDPVPMMLPPIQPQQPGGGQGGGGAP